VVALPLDLRDLLEDLWLVGSLDVPRWFWLGIPDAAPLKYVERVATLGLGLGLFMVAAQPALLEVIRATLLPLAILTGALSAFGLLRFFGAIQTTGQYLTLSFWTWRHPEHRLTAVAWNPDYLAQWLVLMLPLVLALFWIERAAWRRALAGAAAALTALALVFTLQRAGYLTALIAVTTFGLLLRGAGHKLGRRWFWLGATTALIVAVASLVDAMVLGGVIADRVGRLLTDPHRPRLWAAAVRMAADHPVLGVGTGRFAAFFHAYDASRAAAPFGPFWGTAHSLYLHLLAEQGLVGLATFVLLMALVGLGAARALRMLPAERAFLGCGLLAGLAGWLAYGVVQFTLRVHGLAYSAFIVAGAAAALVPPVASARRRFWPVACITLAAAAALLLVRIEAGLARPVSPGYEAGFYHWERQPDGTPARWTRRRAAMSVPVDGGVLELRLRAPLPGIETRPQVVRVWVDRRPPLVIVLPGADWHTVRVPVTQPRGQHVLVELEAGYTVVPSRLGPSRDDRRLGVMVAWPAWRDAAAGRWPRPVVAAGPA
jgi:O-antigen ligase